MKVRSGFVSNSSSTSFLVAWKKGMTQREFKKELINALCPDEKAALYSFAVAIADFFAGSFSNISDDDREYFEEVMERENSNVDTNSYTIGNVYASNDSGDDIESVIYDRLIKDITTERIIIRG